MQDVVDRSGHLQRLRDIVLDEGETRVAAEVLNIGGVAGDEVVYTDYVMAFGQEAVAQVGADEAGAPGDEGAHELGSPFRWPERKSSFDAKPGGNSICKAHA